VEIFGGLPLCYRRRWIGRETLMAGGKARKVNPKVEPDVLALLRQWRVEHEAARLAKNGVLKMIDLESMMESDIKEFGCGLALRPLLQHLAKEKEKGNAAKVPGKGKQPAARRQPARPSRSPARKTTRNHAQSQMPPGQALFLLPDPDKVSEWDECIGQGEAHFKDGTVLDEEEVKNLLTVLLVCRKIPGACWPDGHVIPKEAPTIWQEVIVPLKNRANTLIPHLQT
jgi:hypothetical protein